MGDYKIDSDAVLKRTFSTKRETIRTRLFHWSGIVIFFLGIAIFVPSGKEFGILTLIPSAFLLIYILWTKRIVESLILASMLGFLLVYKEQFLHYWSTELLNTVSSRDIGWLIIVCGLMGSLVSLIEATGGVKAFGDFVAKRADTERSTLLWTWILGIVIFIDDFLNVLTVGMAMRPCTDRHKIPREMLAYVVDSTAAPISLLVPISTWGVFVATLLEKQGLAPDDQGVEYYIATIPYNFYCWAAALMVPLVVLRIIPVFGAMRDAYKRVDETGRLAPEGSEKIDILGNEPAAITAKPRVINFFFPIIVLVIASVLTDLDLMFGVIIALLATFFFYLFQGIMDEEEFIEKMLAGIKNMILPLVLVILSYLFAAANKEVGFTDYIVAAVSENVPPALFPAAIFILFGITEFIMGLAWGMYVIALPIAIPAALNLGVDPVLAIGAVVSAGAWGSHICFFSDATILTSAATGCDNYRHALTQAYFGFAAAIIALIAFIIAGYASV